MPLQRGTAIPSEGGSSTALPQSPVPSLPADNGSNGRLASTETHAANESLNTRAGQHTHASVALRPRILRPEALAFERLESREGVVLDVNVDEGFFRARLVDPRAKAPDQEVDVELEQVSPIDVGLVARGALFFWAIGYVTRRTGRRNLVLMIDFRRLPKPWHDVVARAEAAADEFMEDMNWS